eukprot:Selendium_serpulae@DN6940_c0_g1_i1.p1
MLLCNMNGRHFAHERVAFKFVIFLFAFLLVCHSASSPDNQKSPKHFESNLIVSSLGRSWFNDVKQQIGSRHTPMSSTHFLDTKKEHSATENQSDDTNGDTSSGAVIPGEVRNYKDGGRAQGARKVAYIVPMY